MIRLKQYRDKWLAEGFGEYIGFYPREFTCLCNFSAFGVVYRKEFYPTTEHLYHVEKFLRTAPLVAEKIKKSLSSHDAQKIAYANADKVDPKWDEKK